LSIGADHGELGHQNHEFDGFFAFIQQQPKSQRKPDHLWNRRFSTTSTNPYSGLRKLGSGDGSDDRKPKLLHRFPSFLVLEVVIILSHALDNLHEQLLAHPKPLAKLL
jgi:hypothetical protein